MQPATRVWLRRAAWLIGLAVLAVVTWLAWQQLRPAGLAAGLAGGNGRIEAVEVDIAAREGGRIREILVNEGDFVTAGQELARLDTQQLEARLREARAQLEQARVAVATGRSRVVQRQSEREAAAAVVTQRQAELEAAR